MKPVKLFAIVLVLAGAGCTDSGTWQSILRDAWGSGAGDEGAGLTVGDVTATRPDPEDSESSGSPGDSGQPVPSAGTLEARVRNTTERSAEVTIHFLLNDIVVHFARLHVGPLTTTSIVGPELAQIVEFTGTDENGAVLPPAVFVYGENADEDHPAVYVISDEADQEPEQPVIDDGDQTEEPDEEVAPSDDEQPPPFLDCNSNGIADANDITAGTSADCNLNLIPDECDIAADTSHDWNLNTVPDECEDCNTNGWADFLDITGNTSEDCNDNYFPDECDIAAGTSQDTNNNATPDECDIPADHSENNVPEEGECSCFEDFPPVPCETEDGAIVEFDDPAVDDDCFFLCGGGSECTIDPDCDDGLFCNGAETCVDGVCRKGPNPCCGPLFAYCDEGRDLCTSGLPLARTADEPGRVPPDYQPVDTAPRNGGALSEFYSATGKLFCSVDGAGSNAASHVVEVEKPNATATVRKAFLLAASTGFDSRVLADGDVKIDGVDVNWEDMVPSAIASYNHRADVTALLKPVVDAAAPGRIPFTLTEVDTPGIEGEILVVVFDDPLQAADSTVILLFGAQDIAGDNFSITLAEPIDPAAPGALVGMGLGISFGYQGYLNQYSIVEVNTERLTTAAGGRDDGVAEDGALITVGGLDDSNANPADPFATPDGDPRMDDELYSLLPFITAADMNISVFTQNPSNDDNIFFGYFQLSTAAVLGEGIVLAPLDATNPPGDPHTLKAAVTDEYGDPLVEREVTFEIVAGPNAGGGGTDLTNSNGEATFTYTSSLEGEDQIVAWFIDSQEVQNFSNTVHKEWVGAGCTVTCDPPSGSLFPIGETLVTCTAEPSGHTCTFVVTVTGNCR